MPSCSAWGCSNRSGKGTVSHRFPRDPKRRKIWEAKVRRKNWHATDNSMLCSEHFDETQYESGRADKLRRLKWNAVPTKFAFTPVAKTPRRPPLKRGRDTAEQNSCTGGNPPKKILIVDHSYCKHGDPPQRDDDFPDPPSNAPDDTPGASATVGNTPGARATPSNTLGTTATPKNPPEAKAALRNTLKSTATLGNTLEITATLGNTPGVTATPCNIPGATGIPSNMLWTTATPENPPEATATLRNTLETTAMPSNIPGARATPDNTPGATATPGNIFGIAGISVGDPSTTKDMEEHPDGSSVIGSAKCKCAKLEKKISELQRKLAHERREKWRLQKQKSNFELNLRKLFNEDQLNKLGQKDTKGSKWSNDTIAKALQLWSTCGATGYEMLLAQNQPLPSVRSLRRKLGSLVKGTWQSTSGIELLKLKVASMTERERGAPG